MRTPEQILLDYVIEKSYTDPDAQVVLDRYDAERTGREYSSVALINSLIKSGNTKLANQIGFLMTRGEFKDEQG